MSGARSLFAPHALLPEGWARDVLLSWDERGALVQVTPHAAAPAGVPVAAGPLLPGMPNLHSHAFQRGMAGLTEYRSDAVSEDSFWSWRQLMYRFALRLQPAQLEAMAYGLYVEMLEAGYTAVCEFHYVHHHTDGRPYADDAELAHFLRTDPTGRKLLDGRPGKMVQIRTDAQGRDLFSHEFNHSWDGKYRRPADLWTPNFNVPMQDSLLWVYEGQTQYYGQVIAARSGLLPAPQAMDSLAMTAAMVVGRASCASSGAYGVFSASSTV